MKAAAWFLFLLLLSAGARAGGIGTGFGETFRMVESPRAAASGGVALEDVSQGESAIEAGTIQLSPGLEWYVVRFDVSLEGGGRIGVETHRFQAPDIPRLGEDPTGSRSVDEGSMSPGAWGTRIEGQLPLMRGDGWRLAGTTSLYGSFMRMPDLSESGFGLDAGVRYESETGEVTRLLAWGTAGPLGYGGEEWFSGHLNVGAGFIDPDVRVFNSPGGQTFGAEVNVLGEGPVHCGVATVHWIGDPEVEGVTFLVRAGVRYLPQTVQDVQIRGGFGFLWRFTNGWGAQFDYAYVPMGDLGALHYTTLGFRFGTRKSRGGAWAI